MSTSIELRKVVKRFGAVEVIKGIDLDIAPGEFTVFVGPSGCGKSTLLRMIAGLENITSGDLLVAGDRMNDVHASKRGIAMVFQSYALYPHMTVYKNLAFGLETAGYKRAEIDRRVRAAAETLQITDYLERRPKALSGGQRQRVAIGRSIVRDPNIFLFDEPLSNLDAELRVQMRVEIAKLHERLGNTMIYVTHDQVEAMTMADRIVVLKAGEVMQVGSPLDLYNRPANQFVAGFIGSPKMNFLTGKTLSPTLFSVSGCDITLPGMVPVANPGTPVTFGVRPEHIVVGGEDGISLGEVSVQLVEHLGGTTVIYATTAGGENLTIMADGQHMITNGTVIPIRVNPALCHAFDGSGKSLRA
ncbi:sn-glycerol-3-phosphate ABC transporter ATP-binding protein UgpC [Martelella lutilitoris]|uniref:sn-glycerol-3-phosphate ABC transporter ATP-binding protein UgpC n=1 Tax=Martelella lutilitoris TaxID=2583532 RepID=A0A5C4JLJ5_9HYPH|nr:sn-glycerol-3-phosphate ABC transporter ATP-binding protein UgpC [Martelella lutilitoris]TNB46167.1 sn-glycerol-3-phosphate ABC transporter ATP-binding protein UgpC [Martelella lutilitoris]